MSINPGRVLQQFYAMRGETTEVMVLECIQCPRSITLTLPHALSDSEAAPYFYQQGWSITPALCPRCWQESAPEEAPR